MRRFNYSSLAHMGWDMDIVNLVARINAHRGRQELYISQKPTALERLVEIARIQSTEASNKIEGIITTNTRLKQLLTDKTQPRNRDESEIMGYRDVLNTIHDNHEYIPLRVNYILQLHRDLLKRAGYSYGGRLKTVQNYINETLPDGTSFTRFTPVAPHETEGALKAACTAYEQAALKEQIDPLILIPVFISDFLCIHPFNDGNGRMSRLLTLLLLYQNDFNVGKYISIEKQIEQTKDRYYKVLSEVDTGWHEGNNDYVPFIRYMLQVILSCYVEFEGRVGMMEETSHKDNAYEVISKYVNTVIGKFTSADVLENCPGVGRSSALAALSRLVSEGVLQRHGAGRSTYYLRTDGKPTVFSSN